MMTFLLQMFLANPAFPQAAITLEHGDLKAVFIDNSAYGVHRAGYNGIAALYHVSQDSTLFVPYYAGVNLEHIFGGDSLVSLFEPRRQPMSIRRISNRKVLLHQPETSISKVESWTTFELTGKHYIDVEFRFIVHHNSIFNHGYVGLFWASYINSPEALGINFRGRRENVEHEDRWLYALSERHGENGTHIGHKDSYAAYTAANFNVDLAVEISEYVFTKPFYYGMFHNMVFAYLFETPEEGVIRFSKSPNGAGEGNPAWDFHYILPDFEIGKEYSINYRVIYKEWNGQNDIEDEYKKWTVQSE